MSTGSSILTAKVTLKLLVHKKTNKVVFAEAGNEFVDFLFSILSFPLRTLIKPASQDQKYLQGSLGNLYQSVEVLGESFMRPNLTKESILNPEAKLYFGGKTLYLTGEKFSAEASRKLYNCFSDHIQCKICVSDNPEIRCSCCGKRRHQNVIIVSNSGERGFVKGATTYMVTDDLEVQPMSGILGITLLNKLKIPAADVEEKVVEFGLDEGLALVEASLQSKTVLTKVFLGA